MGATYKWPIAESVDIEILSPTSAAYTLHMGTTIVNDPDILESTPVEYVFKQHWTWPDNVRWGYYNKMTNPNWYPTTTAVPRSVERPSHYGETFVHFANTLALNHGQGTITDTTDNAPNGNECIGTTLYSTETSVAPFDAWYAKQWNGGAGTAGNCLGAPAAHEWCALTQPAVTLSHGRATLKDASGNLTSGSVGVECTTAMKFTLNLRAANNIALSNGMTSHLTVDGRELGTEINGTAGANVVAIQSTLQGTPQGAGPFEGHGVLMVSYP